ncbi:hypothetical protein FOA52_000005 [Chlamydomonas sp. UWO 241]|nr:hypothetical protein FOA52_000005 [Chlamydomonas sp. UWO 241]
MRDEAQLVRLAADGAKVTLLSSRPPQATALEWLLAVLHLLLLRLRSFFAPFNRVLLLPLRANVLAPLSRLAWAVVTSVDPSFTPAQRPGRPGVEQPGAGDGGGAAGEGHGQGGRAHPD